MATSVVAREYRGQTLYLRGSEVPAYSWTQDRADAQRFTNADGWRIAREYNGTAWAADGKAFVIDATGSVGKVAQPVASYVVANGEGGSMHVGAPAVRRFQLLAMRSALKLEMDGLRHSRGSVLKAAKAVTGLRTNDRAKHIARLDAMARELDAQIEFRATGETP